VAYGARLESVLGASPRGFESPILRSVPVPAGASVEEGVVSEVRVRPRPGLLAIAVATMLLVTSPLFGVLYWFASANGEWVDVLAAHLVILLLCLLVGARQLLVFTEVDDGRLRGNGIFSPVEEVELGRIARVDLVDTYVGLTPTPVRQLLVRDRDGARLFRMRGNYWRPGDLEKVAASLPVAAVSVTEPIDLREFFGRYPGSAYWFENRRIVTIIGVALGLIAISAITFAAMVLAGEPFAI
jgi:hypothetical protein